MPPIINPSLLNSTQKSSNYTRAGNLANLVNQIVAFGVATYDFLIDCPAKEMAGIANSMLNFYKKSKKRSKSAYPAGTIVMIDLGLGYGFELAFKHPAVVLHDDGDLNIVVAPCSSSKFGKGWPIVDGDTTDGFAKGTGCAIDAVRSIHKVRVYQTLGTVTPAFLAKLKFAYLLWHNREVSYLLDIETERVDMLEEALLREQYYTDLLLDERDYHLNIIRKLSIENATLRQYAEELAKKAGIVKSGQLQKCTEDTEEQNGDNVREAQEKQA